jgi:hypothetical protein
MRNLSEAVSYGRNALKTNPRVHLILEYISEHGSLSGEGVPIDAIMEYGIDRGLSLDEMEGAMIHASALGWIVLVDHHVHLTRVADIVMSPANDNGRG